MLKLAPYAVTEANSRGRRHDEPAPVARGQFQRDRDRIVHSTAFRRLEYKTQVFVNHEGDLFRTRLTHSIEVAQITRGIARELGLNEDLAESIAFAHDLGHTPFGHAGQDALNACMKDFGGFEHNLQSLRTVDLLEDRYAGFDGLNLMFETREGILKHCSRENALRLGELGRRFIERRQPSLEAQLANVADEIAYNHHDIDDGLRASLIPLARLRDVGLFREIEADTRQRWHGLDAKRLRYTVIREMLNRFVQDLIETSRARIAAAAPADVEAVRAAAAPMIVFSPAMREQHLELTRVLRVELYEHVQVYDMAQRSQAIVRALFETFMREAAAWPGQLPPLASDPHARAQQIADYVAGMTDRYAIAEYERIRRTTNGA